MPGLVAKWEPILGVKVERVFVQQMKTKWGGCNPTSRSIRVNSDLAKKSPEYLEYIVVHEMAHLLVRHHNDLFKSLMDRLYQAGGCCERFLTIRHLLT
jgi:predicted metal-dependent hydrolase